MPTVQALKRGGGVNVTPSSKGTRSSSRLHGDAGPSSLTPVIMSTPSKGSKTTPLPLGTRVSRRLRDVEDEWQQIPDEWLGKERDATAKQPNGKGKGRSNGRRKNKAEDEESELSELTDEEEHQTHLRMSQGQPSSPTPGDHPKSGGRDTVDPKNQDDVALTPVRVGFIHMHSGQSNDGSCLMRLLRLATYRAKNLKTKRTWTWMRTSRN